MAKIVKVSLTAKGFRRIVVLPINENNKQLLAKHNFDAEEAAADLFNWSCMNESLEQLMEFMFGYSGYRVYLNVVDEETEDELYYNDKYKIDSEYFIDTIDEDNIDYCEYIDGIQPLTDSLYISKGISTAWKELPQNKTNRNFMVYCMKEALNAYKTDYKHMVDGAILIGESELRESTISFYIELEDDEHFDVSEMDFIRFEDFFDDYSPVLSDVLDCELILLNALIYKGKMY